MGVDPDCGVFRQQSEKKPALLLPDADGLPVATQELAGNVVAEPPGRRTQNLHGLRPEPELLVKLAIERIFGSLAVVDAALRKLPGIPAPDPTCPDDLTLPV